MTKLYKLKKDGWRFTRSLQCFKAAMLVLTLIAMPYLQGFAQESKRITGKVTSENAAMPGVSIQIKGTSTGSVTDVDGVYTINAAPGNVLVFKFIGLQTRELTVGASNTINVNMIEETTALNDVVVIGYGTRRRADVTSSISSVSGKALKDLAVAGADQALQGKVSGVTINTNGGQPGGGVSVRVRGVTSINGNEPLYVVDGVPLASTNTSYAHNLLGGGGGQTSQSALATINPNDIASIDILKDASAQAIYGSLAANGVVLITTKKGQNGIGKLSYEGYVGALDVQRQVDVLNLSEYAQYHNEVSDQLGFQKQAEFQNPSLLGAGSNWQNGIYQTGKTQNHQFAFSGGNDKSTYYTSMNYYDQSGVIVGSKFNRVALRINADNQVKDWFKTGISVNASRSAQQITLSNESDGVVSIALMQNPAAPIKNADGSWGGPTPVGGAVLGDQTNPVALALQRDVSAARSKVFGSIFGDIAFTKHLSFRNELGYDFNLGANKAFEPTYIWGTRRMDISKLRENRDNSFFYVFKNLLNFNQTFGGKHAVDALFGHESQLSRYDNVSGSRDNLVNNIPYLNAGSIVGQNLGGGAGVSSMESWLGRTGYTFDNRYALTLSLRRDASSTFGPDKKIGYFPAASIGWTVTNEEFAKNLGFINYLKFRAGVGSVGNQNAGNANYQVNIAIRNTPFGSSGFPANVGNPELAWESVTTYNGGMDLTIAKSKVELSLDVYKKITTNMLMQAQMPQFTGIGTNYNDVQAPWVNAGNMTNTGFDIGLNTYNITKEKFRWTTNMVFTRYKNILNSLNSPGAKLPSSTDFGTVQVSQSAIGQPMGMFFGYQTDGIIRNQAELDAALPIANLNKGVGGYYIGDLRFKDIDGDGSITNSDATYIGNPNPDFTYGLTNRFEIRSFDFSFFIQGSQGAEIMNYTRRNLEGMNNIGRNQLSTVKDRFSATNPNGSLPRFTTLHTSNIRVSDRFIEDGSYLRIQNVSLGYNLPKSFIKRAKLSNARVYATAQNLYTFTKYTGYDPELGAFNQSARLANFDNGNYPNPRTFTFGLNLDF